MVNKFFCQLIVLFSICLANNGLSQLFIDSGQNLGDGRVFSIVLGDFDADNDSDAFIVDYLSQSEIWFNDGQGDFTYSGQSFGVPSQRGHDAAIGDLDKDGDNDIFFVNNEGPNKILLNDGTGIFPDCGQLLGSSSDAYLSVTLSDVDGDDDLDALLSSFVHHAELWLNDGNGVFTLSGQNIGNNEALRMGVDDFDGDNDPDILLNNLNGYDEIWFNDGSGNFTKSGQNIGIPQSWGHISLSDIDNDNDVDAFITNYEFGISKVWINNGQGIFSEQNSYSGNGEYVVLGDLNNDGFADAITCGVEKWMKIWINDGTGNFILSDSLDYNAISAFLGDVDNDSDLDIVVGYWEGSGGNKIFLNQTITGIKNHSSTLSGFKLERNYPNPFNPITTISFKIPIRSNVSLMIYDILGNEVVSLLENEINSGEHKVQFDGTGLSSGIYFYQFQTNGFTDTKRMFLIK